MGSSRPREEELTPEDEGPPLKMIKTDEGASAADDNEPAAECNGVAPCNNGEAVSAVKIGFIKGRCQPSSGDFTKVRCQPSSEDPSSRSILINSEDGVNSGGSKEESQEPGMSTEEMNAKLDEENADKYRCGLCVIRKYFERLFELHDHLLEFHLVLNDEDAVNEHVVQPLRPAPKQDYPSTTELLGPYEQEPVDPLIFEPQTFRPTYEEFKDLQGYIKYMESKGAHKAGIAKIVVPREWIPRKQGYNPSDFDIVIQGPVQQNISCSGVDGAFKTIADRSLPPISIEKYMKLATGEKYLTPAHNSYEELEQLYWRENLDETKLAPIYGADVEESITDPEVEVWNIKRLNSLLTDVLDEQIPGVNTPYLYVGMWKATFSWHVEDMDLYAVNFIHYGAPKTWYGIPPSEGHKLEQLAQKMFPDMGKTCFNLMRHKAIMISPKLLEAHGVRVNKLVQEERNIIVAFPHAYHSGFNHGFNMAESTNFAIDRWVEYGKRFRDCLCRGSEDEVSIDLKPFVKEVQPEKYQDYVDMKDFGLHPEDPWYVRRCWQDAQLRLEMGHIDEDEFNNLKKHLKKKRQIPFWWKQKFDVDYYHEMRDVNFDLTDCVEEEEKKVDKDLEEKKKQAKMKMLKVEMKPMSKSIAQIFLSEMREYNEMRQEMYRDENERKKNVMIGYGKGNDGKALGAGQAKGVGFKNVDQDDLVEKRSKVVCRAKKNHRFKACTKCTGCKTENCGDCVYCLDMPRFGGRGLLKQKCEKRLCINPLLRTCDMCEWVI